MGGGKKTMKVPRWYCIKVGQKTQEGEDQDETMIYRMRWDRRIGKVE